MKHIATEANGKTLPKENIFLTNKETKYVENINCPTKPTIYPTKPKNVNYARKCPTFSNHPNSHSFTIIPPLLSQRSGK